jgi:hypothetical protein
MTGGAMGEGRSDRGQFDGDEGLLEGGKGLHGEMLEAERDGAVWSSEPDGETGKGQPERETGRLSGAPA